MMKSKFDRLVTRLILTDGELEFFIREAGRTGSRLEDLLLEAGVPKHELLLGLSGYYGYPYLEYDESVIVSQQILRRVDMEALKKSLWLPLSIGENQAEVLACYPDDQALSEEIRVALKVQRIDFKITLPHDLFRIIEHNQDLNPGFSREAGRTPLAKVRTFLAHRRSVLSCSRTTLARSRTGLALLRTGLSFIMAGLVLLRVFGTGFISVIEALLLVSGFAAAVDGLLWYLPARSVNRKRLHSRGTVPTDGTTVLAAVNPGDDTTFQRLPEVSRAEDLRTEWSRLSPVMRRRFLAGDRTDLAEERTVLAGHRTIMARARTGLAFTRTGIAFVGIGIGLFRQFPAGMWTILDIAVSLLGAAMMAEGLYWYLPGRKAGLEGADAVKSAEGRQSIWRAVFPFPLHEAPVRAGRPALTPIRAFHSPGIWGTTGLALERTLLAERRNVMARLRTIMARSRTGMAFIRTGMSMSAVGLGLLVYFGAGNPAWTAVETVPIVSGLFFIADGLFWHLPAERVRRQFPYCFGEMEIPAPDYGVPVRHWRKAVFSHDEI